MPPSSGARSSETRATPSDSARCLAAIAALAEVYNRPLSDVSLGLYAEALSAWPIEAVEGAMLEVLRDARFFPSPSEWGEYASEWWRAELARRREERLRTRALSEEASMSPQQRAAAEAQAKAQRDALAKKLGWPR